MPEADGLSFLRQAKIIDQTLPIAVLSASENIYKIEEVFNHGAQGFIPKACPPQQLIVAIESILQGTY